MRNLLITALLGLTTLPAAAAPTMQPGFYSISMRFDLKGMPMQMPVTTFQQCITAQDVFNDKAYASNENKDCKISNLRQNGNQVSYDFNCAGQPGGPRMAGHSSGTSHATGYDIVMRGRFVPAVEGMSEFNQKMQAKRIGACK